MKKILAFILILCTVLSMTSCFFHKAAYLPHAVKLANEAPSRNYKDYSEEGFVAFKEKVNVFASKLTHELYLEHGVDENLCISPISIYMGLALAVECARGETRQEILDAVGVTYDEVREHTKTIFAALNKDGKGFMTELFNSIWIEKTLELKKDTLGILASDYLCDSFRVDFKNEKAGDKIDAYIIDKTHGLINPNFNYSPDTYFALINTLYLKDIWNKDGDKLPLTSKTYNFKNTDRSISQIPLLQGRYNSGRTLVEDTFSAFFTGTYGGYKITFIVPNGNHTLSEVFTAENIAKVTLLKDWGEKEMDGETEVYHSTRVFFPEFKAEFEGSVKDVLADKFGIHKLFDEYQCDVQNIYEYKQNEYVWCDDVLHQATLTVDRTGVEGAAVVYMPMLGATSAAPIRYVYHDFVVDRAFGFVITSYNGGMVFSGVINSVD